MKPEGTRLQIIFVIEEGGPTEVWSWGVVNKNLTPTEAVEQNTSPGMGVAADGHHSAATRANRTAVWA